MSSEELDMNTIQYRAWTIWFYIYYFLELEWERFTPFFNPVFVAALVHHTVNSLELYDVCVVQPYKLDFEEELQICKKRDAVSNECLKTEAITDRDVSRLEVYTFTVSLLYYLALLLPFTVPVIYFSYSMKKKDTSVKFDERIFGASQLLTFSVFLYVCMMPFLLALHSEVVGKIDFGKGEVFS